MVDPGFSAFRGKNRTTGRLAGFLEKIQAGEIEPGSYFLIDSYDRFSREEPTTSVHTLLEIVKAGVIVVTLNNKMQFRAGPDAMAQLMYAVMDLSRAHNESLEKGRKVKAAHDRSKAVAREGGRKWTPLAPAWMNVTVEGVGRNKKITYEPIPERVALIQEMFDKFETGMTTRAIARDFNERGVPTNYQYERMTKPLRLDGEERVRKDKGEWSSDTITTILANRAVIGEHQSMTTDPTSPRGRRPDGPPDPNHYKPIIDEAQFLRVQAMLAARKRAPRVRGSALRMTRPTDCTTSIWDFRGCIKRIASSAGTSTPSERQRALVRMRQTSSVCSALSQSRQRFRSLALKVPSTCCSSQPSGVRPASVSLPSSEAR